MDQNATGTDARTATRVASTTPTKTTSRLRSISLALASLACASAASASIATPNILFFGNSFTGSYFPKDVPALLTDIHAAAGKFTGTFVRRFGTGYSFQAHLQSTGENSVQYLATQVLPAGETWDYVVLQGNSVEPTATMGNPANFVASGKSIIDIIRQSNPAAKAVTFETWARNENITGYYPTPFANPAAMQAQLAAGYRQLYQTINTAYGSGSARYAGVGEAFAGLNWTTSIYANEFYHANNRGEFLAALTVYGALQGPTAAALAQRGALDSIAMSIGVSAADVLPLAIAADAAGAPRGDTDLDWDVDFDDLLTLAQNYGRVSTVESRTDWFAGDFDSSGSVDFDDLLALAQHYGQTLPAADAISVGGSVFANDLRLARSLVPEPTAVFAGLAAFALCPRTRRAGHPSKPVD